MVLALNMADSAEQRGIRINIPKLSQRLDMPVVETVAIRKHGVEHLLTTLKTLSVAPRAPRQRLELQQRSEDVETLYARIDTLLEGCVTAPLHAPRWQERLDALVMHPVWGLLVLTLLLMFQAVFAWASPLVDTIDGSVQWIGEQVGAALPEGILQEFVVNGFLIAGTGSVLVFLPQIIILFAFILALEDSEFICPAHGVSARPSDARHWLVGAFIYSAAVEFRLCGAGHYGDPLISDPKERLITIMVAPLMTCSARLPVYALIIGAFIPEQTVWGMFNLQGLTLFALYLAGIISAALIAWILRRHQTQDDEFPLLLELPNYRWPNLQQFYSV